MRYKLISVFEALGENDKTDGRGERTSLGYFFERKVAEEMVAGKCDMDGPDPIRERKALELDTGEVFLLAVGQHVGPVEVFHDKNEALRASGLAKLSTQERDALGIR